MASRDDAFTGALARFGHFPRGTNMFFIDKIPPQLEDLFRAVTFHAHLPQQAWIIRSALAMGLAMGRRNVKSIWALLDPEEGARSTLNDFFTQSPWVAPKVLQAGTLKTIEVLDLKPGETIEVILDGTQKAKRGSHMDALGWICEAGTKEWRKGHRILVCYLRIRGLMLPWAVDLYLSEKFLKSERGIALKERIPGTVFRNLNEMAAEMIGSLPEEWRDRFNVVVLMDSGFCNKTVGDAVTAKGFRYIVAAQPTRKLVKCTGNGKRGKRVELRRYAPGRLRFQGRDVLLPPKRFGGRPRRFRVAETMGSLKGLGEVKVVFSQRRSDGNVLCLVSSDTKVSARDVALAYGWRWEIEVAIKGLKQRLGFGQYQCRYYEGMVHHLHLTLLAHLMLTFAELQRGGKKNFRSRAMLQCPSLRDLQNRLRKELWRQQLEQLRKGGCNPRVLARMERALNAS